MPDREDAPTFCDAVVEVRYGHDGETFDEVRCTDRYGHEEAHSAKIWWSSS